MSKIHAVIDSVACALPPVCLSSAELEAKLEPLYTRLKLPEGRLEAMTGIKARRLWAPGTRPSDAAAMAAEKLFTATDFPKARIGAVIFCSVCRDFLEPATATLVHQRLGLPATCQVFDISNACLGMFTGAIVAESLIASGVIESALLVSGEVSNAVTEATIRQLNTDLTLNRRTIKPSIASLTLGSGAAAMIVCKDGLSATPHKIVGHATVARTEYNGLCRGNADQGMQEGAEVLMSTDSEALMLRGIETAAETWDAFKNVSGWTNSTPDVICTHQVGSTHKALLLDALHLDPVKDFPTLAELGNSGSASAPTTLALAVETGRIGAGSKVALLGIGSGINCSMIGIEW